MRRWAAGALGAVLCAGILAGCGSKEYNDGTYTAQSSVFEGIEDEEFEEFGANGDGYGVVTITIKDNVIVDCQFQTFTTEGVLKDEEYGKKDGQIANQDYYNKAQRAVQGSQKYAQQLAEAGSLDGVDEISGATISYGEFKEAVGLALKDAQK